MEAFICDCGHWSTPDGLAAGYARGQDDDKTMCYQCAANVDLEYARTMTPADPPLFAYVKPLSGQVVAITTWPGLVIGRGYATPVTHGLGGPRQYVVATIGERKFHGRHYPDAGDYVRLRPYKTKESR